MSDDDIIGAVERRIQAATFTTTGRKPSKWYIDSDGWCILCGTAPDEPHVSQVGVQVFRLNDGTGIRDVTREEYYGHLGVEPDENGHYRGERSIELNALALRKALREIAER